MNELNNIAWYLGIPICQVVNFNGPPRRMLPQQIKR